MDRLILMDKREITFEITSPKDTKTNYNPFNQIYALLSKNISIQKRQIATNLVQILTPVIGLLMLKLVHFLAMSHLDKFVQLYEIGIPFFLNIPYGMLADQQLPVRISDCDQFYAVGFTPNATKNTIEYLGYDSNTLQPISDNGMLTSGDNILRYQCKSNHKTVPYFNLYVSS